jgi:spermidine/putrescine transport system permease protein
MAIFIIIPVILVFYYAFTKTADGHTVFTLENFARAFEPIYLGVMWRSIRLAFFCTVICLLLGYPVAYIVAQRKTGARDIILFLIIVPMWMNFLLRTYAWLTILEQNGIINSVLAAAGLPKLNLLYNEGAVILGMVYNFLPFMILPIHTILKKTDLSLVEAAQDLGANGINVFFRVVFPLSIPGVISGITMVFMPAVTAFIISNLLGGKQVVLIGNLIEDQFLNVYNWHFGSALSVILMIIIVITIGIFSVADPEEGGAAL